MYEAARWLTVEAQYIRSCKCSHLRTTVKNESGTNEFPSSPVGATPYLEKGERMKKKIYI